MRAGVFSRFLMHRLRGGVPARLPIALPYSLAGGGGGGEGGDGGGGGVMDNHQGSLTSKECI